MTNENKPRNDRILELWNTTQMSQEAIAVKLLEEGHEGATRQIVGGVIARIRTRTPEKIKRQVQNRPGPPRWRLSRPKSAGIGGAIAAKKKLVAEGKKPPSVDPALSRAMGEAVADLKPDQCRFPLNIDEPEFAYCSEVRRDEATCYCATHHCVVYRPWVDGRRNKKWVRHGRR